MRTKDVTIGEVTYRIGKLSCGQVDEIIFAAFEISEDRSQITAIAKGTKVAMRKRMCPAIAAAFNNAREGSARWFLHGWDNPSPEAAGQWWTGDDASVDLDYGEMVQLYEAVASLSGLRASVEKGKAKPEGEDQAVAEPTVN